jgi:hypothetical protein
MVQCSLQMKNAGLHVGVRRSLEIPVTSVLMRTGGSHFVKVLFHIAKYLSFSDTTDRIKLTFSTVT